MDIALVTGSSALPLIDTVDGPLVAALQRRGARVHRPRWDDATVGWSDLDVALVRTTWDYPARRDAFVAWAAATAEVTELWNPADVLRWNTHKSYLIELEERGAPVVPTAWLGRGDRVDLDALLRSRGWSRAVIKPAVGAGAEGVLACARSRDGLVASAAPVPLPTTSTPTGTPPPQTASPPAPQAHLDALLSHGDALVQPYLDAVERDGERSVVVVAGEPTHAVRKLPAPGGFLTQSEHGARTTRVALDAEVAGLVRWVVDATGASLLAARVDLLADDLGAWQVVEVEATEPELFLEHAPEAAERLADALVERARR